MLLFQTGELMGDVGLEADFQMGDQANATQMVMQTKKAPAAPHLAGAETVMLTAKGLEALTSVVIY